MANLLRRVFPPSLRRLSLSARRNERRNKNLEKLDEPIDEQFHYMPMGKSDLSMQTRVSFISKDMSTDDKVGVHTISSFGFRLIDGNFMYGPIAVFPKTVLSWRVATVQEITAASLELFYLLEPKLDLLVVGVGDQKNVDQVNARVAPVLRAHKIPYEILSTEFAIPTFNFMNNDGRYVAAALFPPDDIIISRYQYGKALSFVRDYTENEFSPLLLGHNLGPDKNETLMNLFFEGQPLEEAEAGKKRILEIRDMNRKDKQKYWEERRERAEEDRILHLTEAKQNWAKLLEERAKEKEEAKKLADE